MRLEYKCDFNSGNSLKMLKYSVNNSILEIFKCALRVCSCFLVTPCRFPLTPTSTGLRGNKNDSNFNCVFNQQRIFPLPFVLVDTAVNDGVR